MPNQDAKVITEKQILAEICPVCWARAKMLCFDVRGKMRQLAHPERIRLAEAKQSSKLLGPLDATDKAIILYYAYLKLCASVSVRAKDILGVDFNSEQIQAFFARKAVEELRKDGLLPELPAKVV